MHDRIDSLKHLVRKYTEKTDETVGPLYEKKRLNNLKRIDRLVEDVKYTENASHGAQLIVTELETNLANTRADTSKRIEEAKARCEKEVSELRADLQDRKKMISYYERFMDVERHQILEQIEELKGLTAQEQQARDEEIAQLEEEKNVRMEKMRKEML